MSYPPRICFDGALYHVTCRGDNRERIFYDEADCQEYLRGLSEQKREYRFELGCYCLMPNHVHLVLRTSSAGTISQIMQEQTSLYTRYFNKRHQRVGHVFQGRFFSRLIADERYLLAASCYVHLNPVKAALCSHPGAYLWSSYGAFLDEPRNPYHLVDQSVVLELFDGGAREQRRAYRRFMEQRPLVMVEREFELKARGRPKAPPPESEKVSEVFSLTSPRPRRSTPGGKSRSSRHHSGTLGTPAIY